LQSSKADCGTPPSRQNAAPLRRSPERPRDRWSSLLRSSAGGPSVCQKVMTCAPTYSARDKCHHVISERLRKPVEIGASDQAQRVAASRSLVLPFGGGRRIARAAEIAARQHQPSTLLDTSRRGQARLTYS
jgi:hypothetical protein